MIENPGEHEEQEFETGHDKQFKSTHGEISQVPAAFKIKPGEQEEQEAPVESHRLQFGVIVEHKVQTEPDRN